ncbi:hypothetical protein GCM10010528_11370 [Gordonia defluvii]|uniref:Lipoyl-binding domain-containing protein n=2 Tax=Gordoniaceae TaxID=85026 RepID=A0ABP6L5I0_9ACTN
MHPAAIGKRATRSPMPTGPEYCSPVGYRGSMAEDVVAEIVATVLEVRVSGGQSVEVGDTLVLLESMKMEIPVVAEDAGVLDEVKVSVDDVIQAGDVIATYR